MELKFDRSEKPYLLRRSFDGEGVAQLRLFDPQGKIVWTGTGYTVTAVDVDGDGIHEAIFGGRGISVRRWQDGKFQSSDWTESANALWNQIVGTWKSSDLGIQVVSLGETGDLVPLLVSRDEGAESEASARIERVYAVKDGSFLFRYERPDGTMVEGRYRASSGTIEVWDDSGWTAEWQRIPDYP